MAHERLAEGAEPSEQVRGRPRDGGSGCSPPRLGLADQDERRDPQPDPCDHVTRRVRVRDAEAPRLLREWAERRDRERGRAARVGLRREVGPRIDQFAFPRNRASGTASEGYGASRVMTEYLIRSTPGCYRSGVRAEPVPRPASGDTACGSRSTLVPPPMPSRPAWATTPGGCCRTCRRRCRPTSWWRGTCLPAGPSSHARRTSPSTYRGSPGSSGPCGGVSSCRGSSGSCASTHSSRRTSLPPPTRSDAVVLVVHDLAFEVMPEAGPEFGERWRRRFDGWLRRSAGVIVPSASAKADLLRRHRLDEGRVHVIPHGADRFEAPAPGRPNAFARGSGIGRPFALFVGGIELRKNLGALVEAFARVADADRWLVIAGGRTYWAPGHRDPPGAGRRASRGRPAAGRTHRLRVK